MTVYSAEKEVRDEIMATDVFVKIVSLNHSQEEMAKDIEQAFQMFRDFESRFSRFIEGNELWRLNQSERMIVSQDLYRMLSMAKQYFSDTGGIFNPAILPVLEKEGYQVRKQLGFVSDSAGVRGRLISFDDLELDGSSLEVRKPEAMKIDLGGIGKGYIVDRVAEFLRKKYDNYIVDAGGDMRVSGADLENEYDYWAVGIENPFDAAEEISTVLLRDKSIATSGTNRRKWMKKGEEKHHLIDVSTQKSSLSDLVSVTVISDTAADADVWAKVLFLNGFEKGMALADAMRKPVLFADKDQRVCFNFYYDNYVWRQE